MLVPGGAQAQPVKRKVGRPIADHRHPDSPSLTPQVGALQLSWFLYFSRPGTEVLCLCAASCRRWAAVRVVVFSKPLRAFATIFAPASRRSLCFPNPVCFAKPECASFHPVTALTQGWRPDVYAPQLFSTPGALGRDTVCRTRHRECALA